MEKIKKTYKSFHEGAQFFSDHGEFKKSSANIWFLFIKRSISKSFQSSAQISFVIYVSWNKNKHFCKLQEFFFLRKGNIYFEEYTSAIHDCTFMSRTTQRKRSYQNSLTRKIRLNNFQLFNSNQEPSFVSGKCYYLQNYLQFFCN